MFQNVLEFSKSFLIFAIHKLLSAFPDKPFVNQHDYFSQRLYLNLRLVPVLHYV